MLWDGNVHTGGGTMNFSTAKRNLDKVFSVYIRLRDRAYGDFIRCISCNKPVHWKEADAGHYVNRSHLSLRWSTYNVNAQCRHCNRFDEGNNEGYRRGLIAKIGQEKFDLMYAMKFRKDFHPKAYELAMMAEFYKAEIKKLEGLCQ